MIKQVWVKQIDRTDTVNRYLDDIKKYDLVTMEEEVDLIEKAQNGDDNARRRLMEAHQRYIFSFARQYSNGVNVLDLVNVATEGFADAIDRFELSRGFRLCSYANYWMKERLNKYFLSEHLTIKKSNYSKTYNKVNKIKNQYFLQNGRYPTTDEIMEILENEYDIQIKDEVDVYDVSMNSINSTLDDGETYYEESSDFNSFTSSYNEYEDESEKEYKTELIKELLNTLNERERKLMSLLFGIGCEEMSMEDVAKEMKLTKERVRQMKVSICEKLKGRCAMLLKKAI